LRRTAHEPDDKRPQFRPNFAPVAPVPRAGLHQNVTRKISMKTTTSKKTTVPATPAAKSKTAANLRDLPPQKNAQGGRLARESKAK